jgi:hypothetical protein
MTRSKKTFVGIAILFFAAFLYMCYDIGRRTTFPGSKPQLKERLKKQYVRPDSIVADSTNAVK